MVKPAAIVAACAYKRAAKLSLIIANVAMGMGCKKSAARVRRQWSRYMLAVKRLRAAGLYN